MFGFRRLFKWGLLLIIATLVIMPWMSAFAPESHFIEEEDLPEFCHLGLPTVLPVSA
jgi:hypothetical protein